MARLAAGFFLLTAATAAADPPPNYIAVFSGTTVGYRPPGGTWEGAQHDLVLTGGAGRYVSRTVALELDFGPTLVRGDYASFSLVPGLVWSFCAHAYLAARFPTTVNPDVAVYAAPGVGLIHSFANGLSPTLELNLVTRLGHGKPDLGVAVTLGLLYSF